MPKQECIKLEYVTRDQRHCERWHTERRQRLTASNFGQVCQAPETTSLINLTFRILYQEIKSPALEYGCKFEKTALKIYCTLKYIFGYFLWTKTTQRNELYWL